LSLAWVFSIVGDDVLDSKSTIEINACRGTTCAAWSPTKSLCVASEDGAGIPGDSSYSTQKRELPPHPLPLHQNCGKLL